MPCRWAEGGKSWSQSIVAISGTSESPAPPGPQCWCWCWCNAAILPSPNTMPHTPWHSHLSVTIATPGFSLFPSWPPAEVYRVKLSTYPNHASNKRLSDTKLCTMSSLTSGIQRNPNIQHVVLGPSHGGHGPPMPEMLLVSPGRDRGGTARGLQGWGMWYAKPLGAGSVESVLELQLSSLDRTQVGRAGEGVKCGQMLEGREDAIESHGRARKGTAGPDLSWMR